MCDLGSSILCDLWIVCVLSFVSDNSLLPQRISTTVISSITQN
uniref:IPS1 riboregulator n=1 Tax=Lolium multiflorum TaxID=4521 RepID=A5JQJ0_LOLMU|nr:IPS1 riboregulator [Lolium multiflorum]